MSIIKIETGTATPNFLESAVGLVLKTRQLPQSMGAEDGQYKTVAAGTPFPSNDAQATGIVYQAADVTDGDAIGSVMVAGRVLKDSDDAIKALIPLGITFVDDEGKVYVPAGAAGVKKLSDLEDVEGTDEASPDQVLKYTDNKWKPGTDNGAGA